MLDLYPHFGIKFTSNKKNPTKSIKDQILFGFSEIKPDEQKFGFLMRSLSSSLPKGTLINKIKAKQVYGYFDIKDANEKIFEAPVRNLSNNSPPSNDEFFFNIQKGMNILEKPIDVYNKVLFGNKNRKLLLERIFGKKNEFTLNNLYPDQNMNTSISLSKDHIVKVPQKDIVTKLIDLNYIEPFQRKFSLNIFNMLFPSTIEPDLLKIQNVQNQIINNYKKDYEPLERNFGIYLNMIDPVIPNKDKILTDLLIYKSILGGKGLENERQIEDFNVTNMDELSYKMNSKYNDNFKIDLNYEKKSNLFFNIDNIKDSGYKYNKKSGSDDYDLM